MHTQLALFWRTATANLNVSTSTKKLYWPCRPNTWIRAPQVLVSLGFGGGAAVRPIPARFLAAPSLARGVSAGAFRRLQEREARAGRGHLGYRGLTGPSTIPATLVDKILQVLHNSSHLPPHLHPPSLTHLPDLCRRRGGRGEQGGEGA